MKILIVEDDPVYQTALSELLIRQGHEVRITADGIQAWEALEQEHYPVAILDWIMPRMDGLALCRKIRHEYAGDYVCVIMLTIKSAREDRINALIAGADVFLTKPTDPDDLTVRLQIAERVLNLERKRRSRTGERNRQPA